MEAMTGNRIAWRIRELAFSLRTSAGFLRNEIRRGALVARKCGGAVIVLESDLQAYLDQRRVKAQVPPNGESHAR